MNEELQDAIKEIIKQHLTVEVYKRVGWFGASDIVVRLKLDDEIISEDNMTLTEGSES